MRKVFGGMAALALIVLSLLLPVSAANASVGSRWTETLPTGERVEFVRTAEGMDVATAPLAKRDLFSCTSGYTCVWTGTNYTGTFGRYNTNNIYANTANGVAHCWNMASPFADNTKSWANFGSRIISFNNWQNCNPGGGWFDMGQNSHWDCNASGYTQWCTGTQAAGYPRTSSIRALAN